MKYSFTTTTGRCDEEVTVNFSYDKGYDGSWEEPSYPESVEIIDVIYKDIRVDGLLSETDIYILEGKALDYMDEVKQEAIIDYYEYNRTEY